MSTAFQELIKESPSVADVHTSSAGASRKRPRSFRDIMLAPSFRDRMALEDHAKLLVPPRALKPMDDLRSHTPFPYDPNALANMRADQVPRFLGAITDAQSLERRVVNLDGLHAIQDRVDTGKVQAIADTLMSGASSLPGKPPVVVRMNGKNYIADGHHRLAAQWLNGEHKAEVAYKDLTARDNAVKRSSRIDKRSGDPDKQNGEGVKVLFDVQKMDADKRLVFGIASVSTKGGRLVLDKQDDVILPENLESAVYDYVLNFREGDDMHTEACTMRLVESTVFTLEKQDALGIVLKDDEGDQIEAWWAGWYVDDEAQWELVKGGARPELSIGGTSLRIPV